ncbi:MAG: AAA family ATPase, partial [Deltaproteobacteria bacterium]|nr:AAA family ATPase [Deltaproteobacteria bacterium]
MSDGAKHDAKRVFLSGPPGSGKSTVGRALAAATDAPFVDLDARVAARAGKPI